MFVAHSKETMLQVNPDILGAQECEGREWDVAANIGSDYAVAGAASAGHAVIYRTSVFSFEGQGYATLNEMDQYGPVGELLRLRDFSNHCALIPTADR